MHVGVSVFFVVFLCAIMHVCTPSNYTRLSISSSIPVLAYIRTIQFGALHIMHTLSFPQYLKHHCVSCAGAGACISCCSERGRRPQNERPARSGLSCGCSGRSEYSSSVFSLYVNYQAYVYAHVYRFQCGPCSESLHVVDKKQWAYRIDWLLAHVPISLTA